MYQLQLFKTQKKVKDMIIPNEVQQMLDDKECKILLTFSGGKDSVAMVLRMLDLGIDKSRIELHHHLVDGRGVELFDWGCTESYCEAFAKAFGLNIVFSYRVGGIYREIYRVNEGLQNVIIEPSDLTNGERVVLQTKPGSSTRLKFPAVHANLRTRWCSSTVKISVLERLITNTDNGNKILVLTGERRRESRARSKYSEYQDHSTNCKSRKVIHWRPIIDFSEKQVWNIIERYKVQPHPAYMLGWSRCSCQLCIFSSPNTWASIYELSPQKVEQIALIEKDIEHTLYNGLYIMSKVRKGKSFLTTKNKARWADEALTTFKSNIFVEQWTQPQGAYNGEVSGSV